MSSADNEKLWDPSQYHNPDVELSPYTVIILNLPIQNHEIFWLVTGNVKNRAIVAADGGANHLKDYYEKFGDHDGFIKLPKAVIGDLDSLLPETRSYFEKRGVPVLKDPDQYSTDFTKCLKFVTKYGHSWVDDDVEQLNTMVFGGLGGRADQAFAQLHQLHMASRDKSLACGDIYLYTEESIMFLLQKGSNLIVTPVGRNNLGENVGIIPLSAPATITTEGLEWDVKDWKTSFGTQVSTSNHIRNDTVRIITNEPVLFTVELARKPSANGTHPN